jgi:Glycosyl hydrolase family 85
MAGRAVLWPSAIFTFPSRQFMRPLHAMNTKQRLWCQNMRRGTFGGGGMHCDVSIKAALQAGLGSAMFAVGWSYEHQADGVERRKQPSQGLCLPFQTCESSRRQAEYQQQHDLGTEQDDGLPRHHPPPMAGLAADFTRNKEFWSRIAAAWGRARPTITELPFATDFSDGKGLEMCQGGGRISALPWYNLSLMSPQPLLYSPQSLGT